MNYTQIIKSFPQTQIMVIGDLMLDRYWQGNITRISPEAPVPIVNFQESYAILGGAANVAKNVRNLGAKVDLIGVFGADTDAQESFKLLELNGISPQTCVVDESRQTTVKTRIVAHQQHVLRIDKESVQPLDNDIERKIIEQIEAKIENTNLVIVSDYAKGVLTKNILFQLLKRCRELEKPIFVDPKGTNFRKYSGATLLTPNRKEAFEAVSDKAETEIESVGRKILDECEIEAILITLGEDGMILLDKGEPFLLKASSRDVFDVTGAGDTVISTLAVAFAAGADLRTSATIANIAAGIVIQHFGTTAISLEDLMAALAEFDLMS